MTSPVTTTPTGTQVPTTTSSGIVSVSVRPPSTSPVPAASTGNSGGGSGFPSSPASNLYLYTFLATLVLLLLVSGAVILRSITLRMRARRAIEEAIRNGTYVPPTTLLRGSTNAAKPVFFDTYLKDIDLETNSNEKAVHWSEIRPIAASFVPSPTLRSVTPPSGATETTRLPPFRLPFRNPLRAVRFQDIVDELSARNLDARAAQLRSHLYTPTQVELASAAFANPAEGDTGATDNSTVECPPAMRVAVLIAMPDPARPMYTVDPLDDSNSRSHALRPSTSSSSSSQGDDKGKMLAPKKGDTEAEAELPYVEFGVAEVPFASYHAGSDTDDLEISDRMFPKQGAGEDEARR